jgi:hypothetical protein
MFLPSSNLANSIKTEDNLLDKAKDKIFVNSKRFIGVVVQFMSMKQAESEVGRLRSTFMQNNSSVILKGNVSDDALVADQFVWQYFGDNTSDTILFNSQALFSIPQYSKHKANTNEIEVDVELTATELKIFHQFKQQT